MDWYYVAILGAIVLLGICLCVGMQERRRRAYEGGLERRVCRLESQVHSVRDELEQMDLKLTAKISQLDRRVGSFEAPEPDIFNDNEEDWKE